jgi:cell shape-determining protein MreD
MKVVLSVEQNLEALEKLDGRETMQVIASEYGMRPVFLMLFILSDIFCYPTSFWLGLGHIIGLLSYYIYPL